MNNQKKLIETVTLLDGVKISGYVDEYVFEKIKSTNNFYECELLDKWILSYAKDAQVIYDIGANLGNHTVYFANNVKGAKVFSFEPMKENYNLLEKNVEDNNLLDVTLYNFALGENSTKAKMHFEIEGNNGTASIDFSLKDGEDVEVKALDELDLPLPDFVKIDVEGFEVGVLNGMRNTIQKSFPILWIEVDEKNGEAVISFLTELGYCVEDFFLQASNNILFVKNDAVIQSGRKLFTALMSESALKRENWILLGKKVSQFNYEQQKANDLIKKLDKTQLSLDKTQLSLDKTQLSLEEKTKSLCLTQSQLDFKINELEQEIKKSDDLLEKLKKKTSNFEYEQNKANILKEKCNGYEHRLDMYSKSKLFRLMLWSWRFNTNLKYYTKNKLYQVGHWSYVKLMPYPKARALCSRINSKVKIFKEPQKIVSLNSYNENKAAKNKVEKALAKKPREINVAMIVDEFTFNSFKYECNALFIEPSTWKKIFKESKVDIFFCESAWAGIDSVKRPWRGQIYSSTNFKNENRGVLLEILKYCNENNIPTVFWNKEDPTHYPDKVHNFVDTAIKFNHIFTTDRDCVEKYKSDYGHKSVNILMFATQPRLFNPIEKFDRTNEIIFAGSWYNQHPARCEEMGGILDNIVKSEYPLKIYDRHSETDDSNHFFPDRFKEYLNPCLPHEKMEVAYKSSKYSLNINTVTNSETMFARRVFELMSSNTLVLSNYSKGMEELFEENVVFVDGETPINLSDVEEKRINALYNVLNYHTYKQRFRQILNDIGFAYTDEVDDITLIYKVGSMEDAQKAYENSQEVEYDYKKAIFYISENCSEIDLRMIIVKYNGGLITVISEDYCKKYEDVFVISTKYFVFADANLQFDFIPRALVHFSYLYDNIGVADNANSFTFEDRIDLTNIILPAGLFNTVKDDKGIKKETSIKTYLV